MKNLYKKKMTICLGCNINERKSAIVCEECLLKNPIICHLIIANV